MREHLKQPEKAQTIAELIAEGDRLLAEEAKEKKNTALIVLPKKPSVPIANILITNAYQCARESLLRKMPAWHRNEILGMEQSHNTTNRFYSQFVKEVAELGDSMS